MPTVSTPVDAPHASRDAASHFTHASQIKGYAVLEVRTRCAVEDVKCALMKNKTFLEHLSLPESAAPLAELGAELLSVCGVNASLCAETSGEQLSTAIDDYLQHKLLAAYAALTDAAVSAVTDIFHSCFISEQRVTSSLAATEVGPGRGQVSGGFICLSKEQILSRATGNLMLVFFSACRSVKKSTLECVRDVLKRYGVPRVVDKDE